MPFRFPTDWNKVCIKFEAEKTFFGNEIRMSQSEPEIETKFLEGEKILCFHGPLIYEAKIQKVEVKDGQTKYFIHYMGWNKNWDEWVSPFLHVSTIKLF